MAVFILFILNTIPKAVTFQSFNQITQYKKHMKHSLSQNVLLFYQQ
jgi:hypothetical protein